MHPMLQCNRLFDSMMLSFIGTYASTKSLTFAICAQHKDTSSVENPKLKSYLD